MSRSRRGFTLIEVSLAVVVGLMIMAAAVYAYQQSQISTKFSSARQMVATIQTNIGMYKFRMGKAPTVTELESNLDSGTNKPFWPGETGGGFPADPVMLSETIATYDSTATDEALASGASANQYDNPALTEPGNGKGGWLYDEDTGSFRINLSNHDYPEYRPGTW